MTFEILTTLCLLTVSLFSQIAIVTDDVYKTAEAIKLVGGKIIREPGPILDTKIKITSCVDPDGWKTVWFCEHFFLLLYFQYVLFIISPWIARYMLVLV